MQKPNVIDRVIGYLSPAWGASRLAARATMSQMEQYLGGNGGYDVGRGPRAANRKGTSVNENALHAAQGKTLRWQAWKQWRVNPYCRKALRSIESKVIGKGLRPSPMARLEDGSPAVEFNRRARELWKRIEREIDYRGRPGRGGQSLSDLMRTLLRGTILSGDGIYRFATPSPTERTARRLTLPLQVQLIHTERLTDLSAEQLPTGHQVFDGIEVDANGLIVAYHILDRHPADPLWLPEQRSSAKRIDASEIVHVHVSDDIDQLRGMPWLGATLPRLTNVSDYEQNELVASALAACVSLLVKRTAGGRRLGVNTDADTTDANGNRLDELRPGQIAYVDDASDVTAFNPARPSSSVEAFTQHMLRSVAASLPGVKGSTLTGDYRNSSFASERAADNESQPEIEILQEWFSECAYQPLYEKVIAEGVIAGLFSGIPGFSAEEFNARRAAYLACEWQGPVLRSINSVDDVTAANARVKGLLSSPQIEAAAMGRNLPDLLQQFDEFRDMATALGLPPVLIDTIMGAAPQPGAAPISAPTTEPANAQNSEPEPAA